MKWIITTNWRYGDKLKSSIAVVLIAPCMLETLKVDIKKYIKSTVNIISRQLKVGKV